MHTFSVVRAHGVLLAMVGLFVALCGRVSYLQTYGREQIISRADRQQNQNVVLPARRGDIFDRNGILMAGSVQTQTLYIDPKFFDEQMQADGKSQADIDAAITSLASFTNSSPAQIQTLLHNKDRSRFVRLADNLDSETCTEISQLDLPGIGVVSDDRRWYPLGSLGCHVLGGVGNDGSGIEGIELKFNSTLSGHDGFERLTKDARRRPIGVAEEDYLPPRHGQHLVLTLDSNLQMIAEQELAATCEEFKAKRGEAIELDPQTGQILAMTNWMTDYPSFNPANLGDSPPEARLNRCVVVPYEPGSTFKPFIAGPALMWGVTTPWEVWPVPGKTYRAPDGRRVTDVHGYGPLTTWDGLVKSSNILMSMMGERLGNARLYAAITRFGFGHVTGVELPGEDPGLVHPLRKWTSYSTESVSQGYEVMVTPMQLARAFCSVANGGYLIRPHIVEGTLDAEGNVVSKEPPADLESMPRVLDDETVAKLRRILCDVVIRGTARGCRSVTWNIAGKTGTSHISEGKAGYSLTRFNSSFMACAPAENPKLVVVFIIHEPGTDEHYGGAVAAPGACRLLERSLTYMHVPPSPDLPQPPAEVAEKLWEFNANQISNRSFGSTPVATE